MKIIFFDGYCSLCNFWVDWAAKKDPTGVIKFASLQGETAKKLIPQKINSTAQDPDSIIYYRDDTIYERSTAIVMILRDLRKFYFLSYILWLVPKFLRNFVYKLVAKNRYRFFPRRETCRVPTAQEKERFLS